MHLPKGMRGYMLCPFEIVSVFAVFDEISFNMSKYFSERMRSYW
jgi:hypothetical protein